MRVDRRHHRLERSDPNRFDLGVLRPGKRGVGTERSAPASKSPNAVSQNTSVLRRTYLERVGHMGRSRRCALDDERSSHHGRRCGVDARHVDACDVDLRK